ncbi:hypothetical protein PspLS_07592 [Pyricularia sp. CBS 133598]|nr:hypothetical protein PspLS_07592 [Pyricularia sp. CBS 133598]
MHFKALTATAITVSALFPCVLAGEEEYHTECFVVIQMKTPFRSSYQPEYYDAAIFQQTPGHDYYFPSYSPFYGCFVKFDTGCTGLTWGRLFWFPETTICPPADAKIATIKEKEVLTRPVKKKPEWKGSGSRNGLANTGGFYERQN